MTQYPVKGGEKPGHGSEQDIAAAAVGVKWFEAAALHFRDLPASGQARTDAQARELPRGLRKPDASRVPNRGGRGSRQRRMRGTQAQRSASEPVSGMWDLEGMTTRHAVVPPRRRNANRFASSASTSCMPGQATRYATATICSRSTTSQPRTGPTLERPMSSSPPSPRSASGAREPRAASPPDHALNDLRTEEPWRRLRGFRQLAKGHHVQRRQGALRGPQSRCLNNPSYAPLDNGSGAADSVLRPTEAPSIYI